MKTACNYNGKHTYILSQDINTNHNSTGILSYPTVRMAVLERTNAGGNVENKSISIPLLGIN